MQKKHTGRIKVIIITVAVLSLCALTVGMIFAKYFNENISNDRVRAQNFYFTSNLLDGKEHTLSAGSTSVTFTIGNHEDALRFSEMDIKYKYTVVDDTGKEIKNAEGTLAKGSVTDATITVSGLEPGRKYTVTATGDGGYTKTLTATIVVPAKETKLYYHIDSTAGDYTLLTVWNDGDVEGSVTVKYTGIPDNTNPNMGDWTTADGQSGKSVDIGPHESKVFRFFGENVDVAVEGAAPNKLN